MPGMSGKSVTLGFFLLAVGDFVDVFLDAPLAGAFLSVGFLAAAGFGVDFLTFFFVGVLLWVSFFQREEDRSKEA